MTLTDLLNAQQPPAHAIRPLSTNSWAYHELAALDGALANGNVNANCADVRSFGQLSADLRPFDHPVFAPLDLPCDWRETIAARRDFLIAAVVNHKEQTV